jgi:hexulose-6-phosphate isomerase
MNRRTFIASTAAVAVANGQQGSRLPVKKGIIENMVAPKSGLSALERFQIAKDVGFECIECHTEDDEKRAAEFKEASIKTGMPIHSVMNRDHWKMPLSSPDPQVVAASVKGMQTSLRNAKLWGADAVLLVPAVVNPQIAYKDAWTRSQEAVRKLIPMAQDLKVVIAVENVWNKFLLSPMEFAQYVDSFKSPWVKAYFDVGNIVLYGYPQDWIRTLGNRIVKVHFKDFRFQKRMAEFVALREGDIDWKEVHKAFADIGYKGPVTVELPGGDKEHVAEISRRVDLILTAA